MSALVLDKLCQGFGRKEQPFQLLDGTMELNLRGSWGLGQSHTPQPSITSFTLLQSSDREPLVIERMRMQKKTLTLDTLPTLEQGLRDLGQTASFSQPPFSSWLPLVHVKSQSQGLLPQGEEGSPGCMIHCRSGKSAQGLENPTRHSDRPPLTCSASIKQNSL